MTRDVEISLWLANTEWSKWTRVPIAGDASSRRYHRLNKGTSSLILMDAPPDTCGSQDQFVEIAQWLTKHSLAAPHIHAWDDTLGLLVLEDLGETDFATHLTKAPDDEFKLYRFAVDVLDRLSSTKPPPNLNAMTPDIGVDMIDIAFEWAARDQSADLAGDIRSRIHQLLSTKCGGPPVVSLRDFHAQNLIWRPYQTGLNRVGLLDFQDAFLAHPMYDVASLLHDVRRDVDPALTHLLITDTDDKAAFHVLSLQRNMRILGIFHRLANRDQKTGYLSLLPRVWSHIQTDLSALEIPGLKDLIDTAFEAPA